MELTPFLPSFLIHPSIVTVCHLHRVPPSACPLPSLTPSLPHSLPPPFFYPIRVTTSLLPKCNPNSYRRLVPSTSHSHIQGWMSGWHMHRGAAGSLPSGNCRWSSLSSIALSEPPGLPHALFSSSSSLRVNPPSGIDLSWSRLCSFASISFYAEFCTLLATLASMLFLFYLVARGEVRPRSC